MDITSVTTAQIHQFRFLNLWKIWQEVAPKRNVSYYVWVLGLHKISLALPRRLYFLCPFVSCLPGLSAGLHKKYRMNFPLTWMDTINFWLKSPQDWGWTVICSKIFRCFSWRQSGREGRGYWLAFIVANNIRRNGEWSRLFPIGPPRASSEHSDVSDERADARPTAASETDGCQFGNIVPRWFSARGMRSTACNSSHYFFVNILQF